MSYMQERSARQAIVDVHRILYEIGFSVANDGNTSMRVNSKTLLITPMGLNKSRLKPEQIVTIDMEGNATGGGMHPPSSERALHLEIYKVRPDVQAIIHAHPPYAIACSLAGVSLAEYLLPEVIVALGQIPTVQYATPSTKEFGQVAAEQAKKYDAMILARHGAVTLGKSLNEALEKLERLEHSAKIAAIARSIGSIAPLPKPEVERLLQLGGYGNPASPPDTGKAMDIDPKLIELITKEVRAALEK